jgi:ubiquinone/menaquinone biosynthesis C-methylase UbiE
LIYASQRRVSDADIARRPQSPVLTRAWLDGAMTTDGHDDHQGHRHGHGGEHGHGHGHEHDRGVGAMLRYLRRAPQMWRSEINAAVVEAVAPASGERVVDIGAGMGPGTMLAARAGADVVAVEPTPFMRSILAARRLCSRSRDRITVTDGAAESLPVAAGSVDAAWAVNTMHHWVDPERAVAEIARVLSPGGRVVLVDEDFADPAHPDYERFASKMSDHGAADDDQHRDDQHGDDQHAHGFSMVDAERMAELLSDAGLVEVDTTTRTLAGRPVIAVTATASLS